MAMGLLSRNKVAPFTGGLAARISQLLSRWQVRLAGWLNTKTKGYSPLRWMVLLVLFCLLAGGFCIYLIGTSFW
jgi:hypothetical protein